MKTLVLWVIGTVLVLVAPLAFASRTVSFDGFWWGHHNHLEKISLLEGEVGGISATCKQSIPSIAHYFTEVIVLNLQSPADEPRSRPHTETEFRHEYLKGLKGLQPICSFTQKFDVYYNEITDYYVKHPKHQSVVVANVLICLSDNARALKNEEQCLSMLK